VILIVGRTVGASTRWYLEPTLLNCDRMIASSYCTPVLPVESSPAPPVESGVVE
jgi:hypothetical protein